MKQAMNSLDDEIAQYSTTAVVGVIVSARFLLHLWHYFHFQARLESPSLPKKLARGTDSWRFDACRVRTANDWNRVCETLQYLHF